MQHYVTSTIVYVVYYKIYFSRLSYATYKERGEKDVEKIFKDNGFSVLYPEKLSVQEQIFYSYNCDVMAVTIGGASMNSAFARPGTDRIFIKKAYLPEIPGDVFQLNQVTNANNIVFLDCFFKPFASLPYSYGSGPHLFGVTKQLNSFCNDNNMKIRSKAIKYLNLCINFLWLLKKEVRRIISQIRKKYYVNFKNKKHNS